MHQTVREFFLQEDGLVAMSSLKMDVCDAHSRIATTCLQYLMFCATGSTAPYQPFDTLLQLQGFMQELISRQLVCYALCHFNDHFDRCHRAAGPSNLVSDLVKTLAPGSPLFYFLQPWAAFHLNETLGVDVSDPIGMRYRNNMLLLGARMGLHQAVEALLAADDRINIEIKDEKDFWTPLLWAVRNGHESTVRLLLDRGADIANVNNSKRNALHFAAKKWHESTVRLLLDRGADIANVNNSKRNALHFAAKKRHESTVRLLLDRGANLATVDKFEQNALHLAAKNSQKATIRLLLKRGADIKSKGFLNSTALHDAAERGDEATVRLLLDWCHYHQFRQPRTQSITPCS